MKPWIFILAFAAVPSLGAQTTAADSGRSSVDVALGVMMATPADVNVRPLCDELNLPCGSPRTFPDFGVVLQLAVTAAPHVAIVAEASRYANRWDTLGVDPAARRSNKIVGLVAGPRVMTGLMHFTSKDEIGCRAFAQVLGGSESSTVTPARFAIQPGAGVDFRLSQPGWWLRTAADYRSTRGGPRNLSTSRWMIAIVFAR